MGVATVCDISMNRSKPLNNHRTAAQLPSSTQLKHLRRLHSQHFSFHQRQTTSLGTRRVSPLHRKLHKQLDLGIPGDKFGDNGQSLNDFSGKTFLLLLLLFRRFLIRPRKHFFSRVAIVLIHNKEIDHAQSVLGQEETSSPSTRREKKFS